MNRQRRSSLVLVFVFGALIIFFVFALALGGGGRTANQDRSAPQPVHDRTVNALKSGDMQAMYNELSPEMKTVIPEKNFVDGQKASGGIGNLVVTLLSSPSVRTDSPWNGEWADAKIAVTRGGIVEEYLIRYHLENGGWWFYATLKTK